MSASLRKIQRDRGHALVIGGSMAGLVAARVLADHFERVTVIDRDQLAADGEFRAGVPQSRHAHILLMRGQSILSEMFPQLEEDRRKSGVPKIDLAKDLAVTMWSGPVQRYASHYHGLSSTRAWLESRVRSYVSQLPGVEFRSQTEALGLTVNTRTSVTGVHVRHGHTRQTIHADLIVEASGRSSKVIDWLAAIGIDQPEITTVNGFVGYATRWYERPANLDLGFEGLLVGAKPTSNPRTGALLPVEGDRFLVTLSGIAREYPPTDEAGFLDFSRRLIDPILYRTLPKLKPVSPIYGYRRTENRWVHFERLKSWPDRFIVVGDAACCFNPIYGQGMSVSAVEALLLDRLLVSHRGQGRNLHGFARRFQRAMPSAIRSAWLLSTGEDFRWPTTEGGKPDVSTRFAHKYIDRLFDLLPTSRAVHETFTEVQHLLTPPTALFHPSLIARVLARGVRNYIDSGVFVPVRDLD
jgi:2-polyprenyl-6-methoxyphenol hydroxylase-like FAD-dependent oxidoreductase